ncbi:hypothetical protein [Croceimicrobium sp.]|uniref:hypothetical protein n=1 Tax=Croceimicrobium sp. TaxID=2828340 RepID=UPI003BAD295F
MKMIKKALYLLLFSPTLLWAHGNKTPLHNSQTYGSPMLEYRQDHFSGESALNLALALLPDANWTLDLDKSVQSPAGQHEHYTLFLEGRKLAFQALSLHYYNNGSLLIQYPDLPRPLANLENLKIDTTAMRLELDCQRMHSEAGILALQDILLPGYNLDFFGPEGAHFQAFVAGSEIFNLADNRRYGSDSTCTANIFLPDPLSTANVNYGGNYSDNNDGTNSSLNAQRFLRNFTASFDNGVFKLENADIKIDDFSAPSVAPATSTIPVFNYTRADDEFEDVNAFFHLSHYKNYIDSLGFTSIPGSQISIDVHALSDADQSYFSPAESRIYMGEGGVDDAEDADVVIHEYGHSLISGAAANTNRISERAGMEEAICDYFAISWSLVFSPNQRDRVFNWDGHNAFWPGRSATSNKDYQTLSFNSNIYQHTDLMASCLLEIRDNTSRQIADKIILEALFTLQNNSTYPDFARMVIQADANLYGGAHFQVIKTAFVRRNVLSSDFSLEEPGNPFGIRLFNTLGFIKGESLMLESDDSLSHYALRDAQGRIVHEGNLEGRAAELNFSISTGLYFLEVQNLKGEKASFKVLR